MTGHPPMSKVGRLDVISSVARRRWTLEEKQLIVAESYAGPRLVSAIARRNGLSASQLFAWRRLARDGRLTEADEVTTFAPASSATIVRRCCLNSLKPRVGSCHLRHVRRWRRAGLRSCW
jgi:transposase-like protein